MKWRAIEFKEERKYKLAQQYHVAKKVKRTVKMLVSMINKNQKTVIVLILVYLCVWVGENEEGKCLELIIIA